MVVAQLAVVSEPAPPTEADRDAACKTRVGPRTGMASSTRQQLSDLCPATCAGCPTADAQTASPPAPPLIIVCDGLARLSVAAMAAQEREVTVGTATTALRARTCSAQQLGTLSASCPVAQLGGSGLPDHCPRVCATVMAPWWSACSADRAIAALDQQLGYELGRFAAKCVSLGRGLQAACDATTASANEVGGRS